MRGKFNYSVEWRRALLCLLFVGGWSSAAAAKGEENKRKTWEGLLSGATVTHVSAFDGNVYASTSKGVFVKLEKDDEGHFDEFFGSHPASQVWLQPTPNDATTALPHTEGDNGGGPTAFVIANNTLWSTPSGKQEWRSVFAKHPLLADRMVLDINGNASKIVFLVAYKPGENIKKYDDTTTVRTQRSDIYLAEGNDPAKEPRLIGSFPATQVFVDDDDNIYTYGDIYGPYGATIGITTDGGNTWRHNSPQTAGKEGTIFASGDMLVVTSAIGNLLRSYDKGRSFEHVTSFNGLPSTSLSAVLVSGRTVFVATLDEGIFVSADEGHSFDFHASKGHRHFPSDKVLSLALDVKTGDFYAGYDEGLVVKRRVGESEKREKEHLSWFARFFRQAKLVF